MIKTKTKQIAMVSAYWFMLIAIPAVLLAVGAWQFANYLYRQYQFVLDPVAFYAVQTVQVPPHIKTMRIYNKEEARARVLAIAKSRKLNEEDTNSLMRVIECESKFQQFDLGVNKSGTVDRGIMQWNSYFHSKMTNEQAFDLDYAVNKAIDYWQADKQHRWTCY
jgi:hypothetical protein